MEVIIINNAHYYYLVFIICLTDLKLLYDFLVQSSKPLFPISYLNRSVLMWPPGHFENKYINWLFISWHYT